MAEGTYFPGPLFSKCPGTANSSNKLLPAAGHVCERHVLHHHDVAHEMFRGLSLPTPLAGQEAQTRVPHRPRRIDRLHGRLLAGGLFAMQSWPALDLPRGPVLHHRLGRRFPHPCPIPHTIKVTVA